VLLAALQARRTYGTRTHEVFVTTTIRFCCDATIAVARASVFALVVALIGAVIVGGNAPNLAVAIVVFLLVLAIQGFRWQHGWDRSA
jgi:hypothetical protein